MKRAHAFSEPDINFLSQEIKKLSDSIEDKKLKEQLGKAIETLSEVKKRFSAISLEKRLRHKYKWFSLEPEEFISTEDIHIPVGIQSEGYDPIKLFIAWCEIWPLSRYLLDLMALDRTFDIVMKMREKKDIGLYLIVMDYASELYYAYNIAEAEQILEDFIYEVMEYAGITVDYNESYSFYGSRTYRYYSWRSKLKKLAAFWMGLSSLFPFSPAFAQQLKQSADPHTSDPLNKAIVQRGKLIKQRSRLAIPILEKVTEYAKFIVVLNENARKAALYGGSQAGDPIFYLERHGIRHEEKAKLLVSQIDTVVASKEIKDILVNPAFIAYLRNNLNEVVRQPKWFALIQKDPLLLSILHGEQDGYRPYIDSLRSYAQQGLIKIVATPENIDIKVYDRLNGSVLYSIRLTADGFAAHPSTTPSLSGTLDQNKVIKSNVVYTISGNIMKVAPRDLRYFKNVADENPQSIGVVLTYRDLGFERFEQYDAVLKAQRKNASPVIYVLFKAQLVIGNP